MGSDWSEAESHSYRLRDVSRGVCCSTASSSNVTVFLPRGLIGAPAVERCVCSPSSGTTSGNWKLAMLSCGSPADVPMELSDEDCAAGSGSWRGRTAQERP